MLAYELYLKESRRAKLVIARQSRLSLVVVITYMHVEVLKIMCYKLVRQAALDHDSNNVRGRTEQNRISPN